MSLVKEYWLSDSERVTEHQHKFHAPIYHLYSYGAGVLVTLSDGCRYLVEPHGTPRQVFLATEDAYA